MNNILFLGYELIKSSFVVNNKRDGKGMLKIHVDSISPQDLIKNINKKNILIYPIQAGVEGLAEDGELSLFECYIEVELRFKLDDDKKITSKFLEKNDWFFENFSHLVSKEILDSLLEKSIYKQINLPSSRFSPKDNK